MLGQNVRKNILKMAYVVRGESVFQNLREIRSTEQLDRDEFLHYQSVKFIELEQYVQSNISFYREASPRLTSTTLNRGLLDSKHFQVVDRQLIISRLNDFLDEKQRVSWRSTSGTTGTPFLFPKDRNATGFMDAVMHQAYEWHGVRIGDRQARLWGMALSTKGLILQSVKDAVLGRKRLSTFSCNNNVYSEYFSCLKSFNPRYFYAYTSALYKFALYLEETGHNGRDLGISVAICTGEMVFPHQRAKISEVFGCHVINEYGSTESGIIGFECEGGCMHVMPTIYLEVEDPDPEGFGHLLVTELNSRSIPFLRYRTGDIGRFVEGDCGCGRPFPCIELGKGRVNDQIICPDGTVVYATIIAYALQTVAQEFRAIQHSLTEMEIQIVPRARWDMTSKRETELLLQKYLGLDMHIFFSVLTKIPPEKSGKLRYFISHVSS